MKGLINRGIQAYVTDVHGQEAWEAVKAMASCEDPFFSTGKDYPDRMTMELVEAVADVTGLDPEAVQLEFGRHWFPSMAVSTYPGLSRLTGKSAREFLLNVDRLHRYIKQDRSAEPASLLTCTELSDGRLRIRYLSDRGLCAMMRGLIEGVGVHFGESLRIEKISCSRDGDDACIVEVGFPCPETLE